MSRDYSLAVRRAVLPLLKGAPLVTDLTPAPSIYPSTVPASQTFPFIRYGAPIGSPFLASGLDGTSVRGSIHGFTKPLLNGSGAVIDTAEDQAHRLADAVASVIGKAVLSIEGGMTATLTWLGNNLLQDQSEADAWHAVINFRADVAG